MQFSTGWCWTPSKWQLWKLNHVWGPEPQHPSGSGNPSGSSFTTASWPKKSVQSSRWHWGQGILPPLPVAREAPWGLRIWCLLWKKKGASEKWSCKTFKQMSSDALCLSSEDTKRVRGILTVILPNAENSPPTIRFKKKKKPAQAGLTRPKSIFGSPLDDASRGKSTS